MSQSSFNFDDIYKPTKKQLMMHQSTADELLYGGAAGGGKSYSAVADAFMTALQFPGAQVFMFRRKYIQLEDSLIKTARRMVPKELGTWNQTRHDLVLVNGSAIKFRHCFTPESVYDYKSAEMNALYIDELTDFDEATYDYLKTRVRANKALGLKPFVRCFSNPGSIGHAWVKKRFVDPHPEGGNHIEAVKSEITGKEKKVVVEYLPATVKDNPHISVDYVYQLESKPKALRDALLYGRWDAFEGQVFVEWMDDPKHYGDGFNTHVITPFPVPEHWPHWMSMDWGYNEPFSIGWWAVDEENNTVYRYAEWYGCTGTANEGLRLDPGQVATEIRRREAENSSGMQFTRVADPAIWDEDRGESIARMFQRQGIHFKRGDNTREPGKMQLHYRMRMRTEGCPMIDGVQWGKPTLYVFSTCRNFIRTIPSLPYDKNRPEDVDTKAEDHVYDETRYFLMEFKQAAYEAPRQPVEYVPGRLDPLNRRQASGGGKYVPRG